MVYPTHSLGDAEYAEILMQSVPLIHDREAGK